MAVAFDAATTDGTGVGSPESTRTFSHTCTGTNRLLIVTVCNDEDISAVTVSSVTYGGVALTQRITVTNSNYQRVSHWYLIAPATGANNVVVTLSGSQEWVAAAVSFTGVNQTTPLGTAASATGNSTTSSVNVASATDEMVYGAVSVNGPVTLTVGAGQTSRWTQEASSATQILVDAAGSTETGAAITTMSWSISPSKNWVTAAVPIKQSTSAGSGSAAFTTTFTFATTGLAGPDYDYGVNIAF